MPKFLRQTSTGRIYPWTKPLFLRPDMVPHPPVSTQALVDPDSKIKLIDIEYDDVHYLVEKKSVPQFNVLMQEHSDLVKENAKLKFELSERPKPSAITAPEAEEPEETEESETPPPEEMIEEKRDELIYNAIEAMVKEGDVSKFAASGLPRVQEIEMICDFNITSDERNAAWEKFKAAQTP